MEVMLAVLLGYLLGSIPITTLLARARGVDLARMGTGNVGGTNLWNQVGPLLGVIGIIGDFAKGFLPPLLAVRLDWGQFAQIAAASGAVAGQMWPVTLRFRGGRGNATATGAFSILSPLATALAFGLFLLFSIPKLKGIIARRQVGKSSKSVPLAVLFAMSSYGVIASALGHQTAARASIIIVALVLIRRLTAVWPPDPATGRPPKRSLVAVLLFDRPSVRSGNR